MSGDLIGKMITGGMRNVRGRDEVITASGETTIVVTEAEAMGDEKAIGRIIDQGRIVVMIKVGHDRCRGNHGIK